MALSRAVGLRNLIQIGEIIHKDIIAHDVSAGHSLFLVLYLEYG